MTQSRMTGAIIVERNGQAQRAQAAQALRRLRHVVDAAAFRHFQLQQAGRNGVALQAAQHEVRQVRLAQLARRNIHGDRHQGQARRAPLRQLAAGGIDAPVAQRDDGVSLLGQADEGVRVDQAMARMVPAQQRFQADQAQLRRIELALVVEAEFAVDDGAVQARLQLARLAPRPPQRDAAEPEPCQARH